LSCDPWKGATKVDLMSCVTSHLRHWGHEQNEGEWTFHACKWTTNACPRCTKLPRFSIGLHLSPFDTLGDSVHYFSSYYDAILASIAWFYVLLLEAFDVWTWIGAKCVAKNKSLCLQLTLYEFYIIKAFFFIRQIS